MNKDHPVLIDNRYLLATLHYQGRHSNFYNAVDSQQEQKQILIQIITDQLCICKLFKRLEQSNIVILIRIVIDNRDKSNDHYNRMSRYIPIPRIYKMGTLVVQDITYHYIAWQKSGPSLKLCFKLMKYKFSLKTIMLVALKMITNLQQIHNLNILHRSLKLSCIMTTNHSNLLITNFDDYVEFLNKEGKITNKSKQIHIKTNKFSSIGQHLQQIPSPRDDLESLGYLLLYLLSQGKLPNKCQSKDQNIRDKFYMEFKRQFLPEKELKQYPEPFLQFFQTVFKLGFKEIPNYEILKQPFIQYLGRQEQDQNFDWSEVFKPLAEQTATSELSLRDKTGSFESLMMNNNKKEPCKVNTSAPTSPTTQQMINKPAKASRFTLAPILEKNESQLTSIKNCDSNAGSPRFNHNIKNLKFDHFQEDSSSGEISPSDEPAVDYMPNFEYHQHDTM
ncbi:unnamed protein product (macronuclear) [Paramecium tetraurelia]|uniref:Casein kinase I n=1 Tax=Paramecium tetraurelia TaxID=5888 RepID=A0DA11_PARTE|nr:uncharacterized protein GSPATT00014810001 [Paramecium tetraurelia]CAK79878.1 unnamed protein product [Paramecium tetraurelia]|eukprot:XP_001447275.1 hypothetical protein (macronuclear) [Paramecium tetraurelia strain d4-2]